ncbi:MAG: hypothetical protein MUD08_06640 [Cytophagales bacterium]|jgi:hypothetical protein|nr:hypothetical protein [Cytophagales bacterium]
MKNKLRFLSSTEVKKAGGLSAYLKKNNLKGVFSDEISGAVSLTEKQTLEALKSLKA